LDPIGTLTIQAASGTGQGIRAHFYEGSSLDLNLKNPDNYDENDKFASFSGGHDVLNLINNSWDNTVLTFDDGATINLNAVDGYFNEGVYRIITLTNFASGNANSFVYDDGTLPLTDYLNSGDGFNIEGLEYGLTTNDYEFVFSTLTSGNEVYLDLTINYIGSGVNGPGHQGPLTPEPASLGLLGLGAGLLLLRRKR